MAGLQLYCSYCEEGTFIEPKEDSPCLFYEHLPAIVSINSVLSI